METTNHLLDAVKARYGLPSDYALAAKLGLTRAQISKYRVRGDGLGEDTAVKVAGLLDLDAGYVLACAAAERAKTDSSRTAWERAAEILKTYGAAAVLLIVVVAPALTPTPSSAAALNAASDKGSAVVCILC